MLEMSEKKSFVLFLVGLLLLIVGAPLAIPIGENYGFSKAFIFVLGIGVMITLAGLGARTPEEQK